MKVKTILLTALVSSSLVFAETISGSGAGGSVFVSSDNGNNSGTGHFCINLPSMYKDGFGNVTGVSNEVSVCGEHLIETDLNGDTVKAIDGFNLTWQKTKNYGFMEYSNPDIVNLVSEFGGSVAVLEGLKLNFDGNIPGLEKLNDPNYICVNPNNSRYDRFFIGNYKFSVVGSAKLVFKENFNPNTNSLDVKMFPRSESYIDSNGYIVDSDVTQWRQIYGIIAPTPIAKVEKNGKIYDCYKVLTIQKHFSSSNPSDVQAVNNAIRFVLTINGNPVEVPYYANIPVDVILPKSFVKRGIYGAYFVNMSVPVLQERVAFVNHFVQWSQNGGVVPCGSDLKFCRLSGNTKITQDLRIVNVLDNRQLVEYVNQGISIPTYPIGALLGDSSVSDVAQTLTLGGEALYDKYGYNDFLKSYYKIQGDRCVYGIKKTESTLYKYRFVVLPPIFNANQNACPVVDIVSSEDMRIGYHFIDDYNLSFGNGILRFSVHRESITGLPKWDRYVDYASGLKSDLLDYFKNLITNKGKEIYDTNYYTGSAKLLIKENEAHILRKISQKGWSFNPVNNTKYYSFTVDPDYVADLNTLKEQLKKAYSELIDRLQ